MTMDGMKPGPVAGPGIWFGLLDQTQKESVLEDVAKEASYLFELYCETLEEAAALQKLTGQELLNAYRQRSPETWAALQQGFSRSKGGYQDQMDEWKRLELRELRAGRGLRSVSVPPGMQPMTESTANQVFPAPPVVGDTTTPAINAAAASTPIPPTMGGGM